MKRILLIASLTLSCLVCFAQGDWKQVSRTVYGAGGAGLLDADSRFCPECGQPVENN